METRVALISIIVENNDGDDNNRALQKRKIYYRENGISYREKGIPISLYAIDAPQDVISLSRKISHFSGSFRQNGIFQCDHKSGGQKMIKVAVYGKGGTGKSTVPNVAVAPCGKRNESDADRL